MGLRRPKAWWKLVLWALLASCLIGVIAGLVQPLVHRLIGKAPDTSRFEHLHGNFKALLDLLLAVWTIVALAEEMVFRGYLMNRIADLVGRNRAGWVVALLGSSLVFGLAHAYQGPAGIIGTGGMGLSLGILYLINKRNLWVNVLAHALLDTVSLTAMYFSTTG